MENFLIKQLKIKYPNNQLFSIQIDNYTLVFRDLSRKELLDATQLSSNTKDLEDIVCQVSLVYPEDGGFVFTNGPAGFPEVIYPLILEFSDLGGNTVISKYKEYSGALNASFEEQAKCMIKAAMPEYTFEIMDYWAVDKLLKEAVRAEYILKNIKGYNIEWKINEEDSVDIKQESKNKLEDEEYVRQLCCDLAKQGIDPIMNLNHLFVDDTPELDKPLIGSLYWNDEVIVNALKKQIHRYGR